MHRMMRTAVIAGLALCAALPVFAQEAPSADVTFERLPGSFTRPVGVVDAGDASGRLFVVQQGGRILIIQDDAVLDQPFLDLSGVVSPDANQMNYTERGLLGLAFAPDYADSGRFYVNYTDGDGNTVVSRYTVSADDPNVADPASAEVILTQEQPYPNHNGGSLAFGPDGYLYIGFGDGGSQGDPENRAQNLGTWLGKILRIDVSGDGPGYTVPDDNPFVSTSGALPEIWAYGVRNPWRIAFDRETGDLFIADVGGSLYEEINWQPADFPGGANYGWNTQEGFHDTGVKPVPEGTTLPIAEYDHGQGISVAGGYVYRGEALPALQGAYFFGDWGTGTIWIAWQDDAGAWQSAQFLPYSGYAISSFGLDAAGELLLVDYNGAIYRMQPAA